MQEEEPHNQPDYLSVIAKLINVILILLAIIIILVVINFTGIGMGEEKKEYQPTEKQTLSSEPVANDSTWRSKDTSEMEAEANASQLRYGRDLVANTSKYFGPQGTLFHSSNGMNCQNCHLDAGTKPYGNNYGAVASTYPKFRARSGMIETIKKRVNDCFERSLNGKAIDSTGKEMLAIEAYIRWLGKEVPKNKKPVGSGITKLAYLDRAADPAKGKIVFDLKCKSCHETNGAGKLNVEGNAYQYPPLWGEHSYNNGAGLYRLSNFASYVKYNMPQGASFENQQLSDEEAWDVAAFVNSQPRPKKDLSMDWPDISLKPLDHPFGPYADKYSEADHKYGPFGRMKASK